MKVLHVEDNHEDADLLRRQLARSAPEIEVVWVDSLSAARTALRTETNLDAALIDLKLPDGNGLDLLADIREQRLALAVIMLTGSGDQNAAVMSLQGGADDYQIKSPAALEKLPATLRHVLARFKEVNLRRAQALRVLYAEHNPADIDLTRRFVSRRAPHIRLTTVNDAEQVLNALPQTPDEASAYDVLLLDYRLPGIDALEAVKVLRDERGLDIPIVIISGQGSEEVAAQAIHLGVDGFLSKHSGYLHELPATLEKVHHLIELGRERKNLHALTQRLNYVLAASPVILYTLRLTETGTRTTWVSGNITRFMGYSEQEALEPGWWHRNLHVLDRDRAPFDRAELLTSGHYVSEYRFIDKSGQLHWISNEMRLVDQHGDAELEVMGAWRDITESKWQDQIRAIRIAVLDGVVENRPLDIILNIITTRLESLNPDMRVSILLRNPSCGRLYTESAPSLPQYFSEAINGVEPQIGVGSCGTAAFTGEVVIVENIQTHPYWTGYAELAEQAGLRACWSTPFKNEAGQVLGTFGVYHTHEHTPTRSELDLVSEFAHITGLAVERLQTYANLRQSAAMFESTSEGVVITDLTPRILQVNQAYCAISGFSEQEVLGRNPSVMRSGRQDASFYETMWLSVRKTGHWRGEIWNRRKTGEAFPVLLTISTVYDKAKVPTHYVGVMTDISQIKQSEALLEHLAHYDPLTDLPNRLLLQYRLEHALDMAERLERMVAVMFIDLDRFKNINDSLGHPVGDEVLQVVAKRMRSRVRESDTLGRLGGDEFLLILENVFNPGEVADVAAAFMQLMQEPIVLRSGLEVYVSVSIGISLYPGDAQTATELIQYADAAMYQSKDQGRNTFRFYTSELTSSVNARLELDSRLRRAMALDEFEVHYQPQIDMLSGRIIGCEALLRWNDPERGMISPAQFIPLAEETGLIVQLGAWVLRSACTQAVQWMQSGLPGMIIAVNLSARQLAQPNFLGEVATILAETDLPAHQLKLELTESVIMGRADQSVELLNGLRELGVGLAIDDFGTGYSSLAYLSRLPIDELKIDRSFVQDIPQDPNAMEIAATIIAMALNLQLRVVAEGVETRAQQEFLAQQGCHSFQGFLFSPAVRAAVFFEKATQLAQGES